jgi:hypothetical protein
LINWLSQERFHGNYVSVGRQDTGMTVDRELAGTIRGEADPAETGYYALTLSADKAANIIWSSVSEWVARGSKPMWEMRAPGLIDPYRVQMAWSAVGQDYMVVRDRVSLGSFLRAGGNALVAQSVARRWLPNVLQPVECACRPVHPVTAA